MITPTRLLLTGPYSANLRGLAIERVSADSLWIVATPMARDQLIVELARNQTTHQSPSVLCWNDLWLDVARRHPRPPILFSDASARSALLTAIDRARERDEMGPLEPVAELPGFRESLRNRFGAWTRSDRKLESSSPRGDAITQAEWAIYRHYRRVLAEHRAEDRDGLANWAAHALTLDLIGDPRSIVFADPIAPSPAQLHVIRWATGRPIDMLVTLPTSGDSGGDDPAITPLQMALLESGFSDETIELDRPSQLGIMELTVFNIDTPLPKLGAMEGLSILSGPKGEGLGLLMAREISRRLDSGVRADDILVLVRQWDDDACRALEIMRDWGIPASGGGRRALVTEPALAVLKLAMSIPIEGWETIPLIRLIRNGLIGVASASERAAAATVLQTLRVFRGRHRIETALNRASSVNDLDRAERARVIFNRLASMIEPPQEDRLWSDHVADLHQMADALRLGTSSRDRIALDCFWDALDDHARIRSVSDRPLSPSRFFRDIEAILVDLDAPIEASRSGTVRLITLDEAEGISARVILLANLGEGTFPTREAVTPTPGEDEEFLGETLLFSRERLQFLHVFGSARDEVLLFVPSTDEKGQDLLPAGFVDDVRRRLGKTGNSPRFTTLGRLDPTFREHPELAQAPADARVLAVARACLNRETDHLLDLLHSPDHRGPLEAVAAGFRLIHERFRVHHFTAFDGLLNDSKLVSRIVQQFGPDHTFSPSQFESFALCPFQFYQKYVLKLKPVEDRPELRIDHAYQGERVHSTLEQIHLAIQSEGPNVDELGRLDAFIQTNMSVELDIGEPQSSDVADGLRAIEDEVVRRTVARYRDEFAKYREKDGALARPYQFELNFGGAGESDYPELVIGDPETQVRFRGKIDRVDLIETPTGHSLRVIDYKTGVTPPKAEVTQQLLAVQLPLYTLAVEQFLSDHSSTLNDFGYWSVRRKGFEKISFEKVSWTELRQTVVDEVQRLAALLRNAEFPVNPQKKECTRYCDYKSVCRIGQIRPVEKEVIISLSI